MTAGTLAVEGHHGAALLRRMVVTSTRVCVLRWRAPGQA